MPAIASLEDLKAAQKDLRPMCLAVSSYDLRFTIHDWIFTLCSMHLTISTRDLRFTPNGLSEDGVASDGKISANYGLRSSLQNN
jgi:hypothetical protein